jgi:tripartite-type tricarboxylate transporter receptor subunit TctC
VRRLNRAVADALESPDLRAAYEAAGRQVTISSPDAMAAMIRNEIPQWRAIVKAADIKAE